MLPTAGTPRTTDGIPEHWRMARCTLARATAASLATRADYAEADVAVLTADNQEEGL